MIVVSCFALITVTCHLYIPFTVKNNERDAPLEVQNEMTWPPALFLTADCILQVEEERDNLQKKIMQMEGDLDQVQENLQEATTSLEEAEKSKTQVCKSSDLQQPQITNLVKPSLCLKSHIFPI